MAEQERIDFGLLARVHEIYRGELEGETQAYKWLASRGITSPRTVERFALAYSAGTLRRVIPHEKRVSQSLRRLGILTGRGPGREVMTGCIILPIYDLQGRVVELIGYPLKGTGIKRAGIPGGVFNWAALKSHSEVTLLEDPLEAIAGMEKGDESLVALPGDFWTEITEDIFRTLCPHQVIVEHPRRRRKIVGHIRRLGIGEETKDPAAAPKLADPEAPVEGGFTASFGKRRYTVQAVTQDKPRHLRALVRALGHLPGKFHLDALDLYSSKDRASFVREAALLFSEDPALIEADLSKLISLAEDHLKKTVGDPAIEISDEARRDAMDILRDPKLFDVIREDFNRMGVVGEEFNGLAGYLVAVSRKMDDPLSMLILSRSAAGKSTLADAISSIVPPEDVVYLTRLTGQALYYQRNRSFRHKLLVVEEEAGVAEAAYPLRVLQSAKKLAVATPHGSHSVEGPVAVLVTTTSSQLNDETKSRFLVVAVDESREQTRAIFEIQRRKEAGELIPRGEVQRRHHAIQRCLRPLRVVNPYATALTFSDDRISTRREHAKYLGLIRAVTFLRQYQRKEEGGIIKVELEDIEAAHEMADHLLGHNLEDLTPPARKLLEEIHNWRPKGVFTKRQVCEAIGWPWVQVWTYMKELVSNEAVVSRGGRPEQLQLLWDGGKSRAFLGLRSIGEIRAIIGRKSGFIGGKKK